MFPTRLEGIETIVSFQFQQCGALFPTRLEGIETLEVEQVRKHFWWFPTRLEGIETKPKAKGLGSGAQVSDPP